MFDRVVELNKEQGNDFIRKHMQNNIEVIDIERETAIYRIKIRSGKWWDRKEVTVWNYAPKQGRLAYGQYTDPCNGKQYTINNFDEDVMEKANEAVKKFVEKWETTSPV